MAEDVIFKYPYNSSLEEKILSVIELFNAPTLAEITFEIAELQAIASEEGISECTIKVDEVLQELIKKDKIKVIKSSCNSSGYILNS